jgi:hypothetical protein
MKQTARQMDDKAKTLAQDYLRTEGELLSHLIEMRKERVFAELNYSGVFDYCERALRLSRAQAYYFKSVAEKSESVPELKEAVVQGEITLCAGTADCHSDHSRKSQAVGSRSKDLIASRA